MTSTFFDMADASNESYYANKNGVDGKREKGLSRPNSMVETPVTVDAVFASIGGLGRYANEMVQSR